MPSSGYFRHGIVTSEVLNALWLRDVTPPIYTRLTETSRRGQSPSDRDLHLDLNGSVARRIRMLSRVKLSIRLIFDITIDTTSPAY
mmetsp:Transcript_29280/g.87770  ORF Transcript_29280/g.87770 Transcript_29280/m.87770 type:complete len:86 (+) Transcript_29280:123-380(+)